MAKSARSKQPAKAKKKSAPAKPTKKPAPAAKSKKASPAKSAPKPAAPSKTPPAAPKKAAESPKSAPAAAPAHDKKKAGPKGITIVTPRPSRPTKAKPKYQLPVSEPLLKPGGPKWKPLIPSGPSAPARTSLGNEVKPQKGKLPKKELDRYRAILIRKRQELVGDVANMEDEALRQSGSGSLSHTPQHMAEQGTDVFDQSLSLDLAQVDRNLIREIDEALKRIEDGTYGFCELTGKPIKAERLEELPWTRFSIEAARERERRPYQL
ncbi:MAG: TraR/DksA C4-type zinc finger protein [Phycisphaeraceae bacterium]|nr:TraR/DksA C4-type zinc finger protein [Phycisphaeraceae bacterium]